MNIGRIASLALMGIAALVGLTIILGSWYTIDQTQRGVLLRNGAFRAVVQPGLHFKLPWFDSVVKIDMQTHTYTEQKMESYSADQQPAHLRVSVTIAVSHDRVKEVYEYFGGSLDAAINRTIFPHVRQEVKVVFGQFTAARAIQERGQLNERAAAALRASVGDATVFNIISVQIEDIGFSSGYIKSVEDRMQAEVEVQRLRQNLERERVQAQIKVTQAQAIADATLAQAKAEAAATQLRGEAEALAIRARGEALGSNPALVSLVQAERWDGRLPTTMVPGAATPMLNIQSPK
jgi:regulator of protease activity HflC (stomatin/prohibitin superfamily)